MKEELKNNYTKGCEQLFQGLDPSENLVYTILLSHRNRFTGIAYPSIKRLAKLAKLGKDTVTNTIASLESIGALVITKAYNDPDDTSKGFRHSYTFPAYIEMDKFEKIPQCVLYTDELSATQKQVYLALFFVSFEDYSYKITQKELAKFSKLPIDIVKRSLKVLKSNEWILPYKKLVHGKKVNYMKLNSDLWLVSSNRIIMEQNQVIAKYEAQLKEKDARLAKLEAERLNSIAMLKRL